MSKNCIPANWKTLSQQYFQPSKISQNHNNSPIKTLQIFLNEDTRITKPSSRRVSNYWQNRRKLMKACISCIIRDTNGDDRRHYLNLDILGQNIRGLLDSGATISVLGQGSLDLLKLNSVQFKKLHSVVRTADGTPNAVLGYISIPVKFKSIEKNVTFFIVPSLKERMYLGIDFWDHFRIFPYFVGEISHIVDTQTDKTQHYLSPLQKEELNAVIDLFPSFNKQGLGRTTLEEHVIEVGTSKPIKQRHYPVSPAVEEKLYEELDRMLAMDVIEVSDSAWSSPVVLVRKSNGKPRLCLDSRKLNSVTEKDAYPLPIIDGLLGRLHETKFISSLDLKDAFWQIPLAVESRDKTAFCVPGRPLYHFKVMPFGLCNAAQRLCRLMHKTIPHELHDRVFVYLDDLLIISPTYEDHITVLETVAGLLKRANLTINVEKSRFMLREIKYLGYLVGEDGLRVDPEKN